MSREGEVLRPSPVAGLLRACAHNLRQGVPAVRLFEVGAGFAATAAAPGAERAALPEETLMLAAIVTGPRYAHAHDAAQQAVDFDEAKGLWEAWLAEMSVDTPEWRAYAAPGWKPGASAEVAAGTSRIGWGGCLGQPLLRAWDIEVPVHLFVVRLDPLFRSAPAARRVTLPGRFPPVSRDLAFFVPDSRAASRGRAGPDPRGAGARRRGIAARLDRVVRRLRRPRHSRGHEEPGVRAALRACGAHAAGGRGPGHPGPHGRSRRPGVRRPTERTMTDTATMTNDLDRLAERIEKAAALLQAQRTEHARLQKRARPARRAEPGARAEAAGAGPGRAPGRAAGPAPRAA